MSGNQTFSGNAPIVAPPMDGIIMCFPEIIEKSPMNFVFCLLYLFGAAAAAGVGFYLYLRERRTRRHNGQSVFRQTTV